MLVDLHDLISVRYVPLNTMSIIDSSAEVASFRMARIAAIRTRSSAVAHTSRHVYFNDK